MVCHYLGGQLVGHVAQANQPIICHSLQVFHFRDKDDVRFMELRESYTIVKKV